ncbi:DUF5050 domain-containing protein, partial [Candidatus Latescibacterota bacterium]
MTTNVLPAGTGTVTRNPDKQIYALHETVQIAANANPGYSFTMGTGWSGDITGTTNPVTITMDSDKTITANFVVFYPLKHLTLSTPNGGESWTAGTTRNITWTSTSITNVKLEYSTDSGVNWSGIASVDASIRCFRWVIPDVQSANSLVRVSDESDASVTDISDAVFAIVPGVTLTTNVLPAGAGYVTRNPDKLIYELHETVQIAANANPGYDFTIGGHWSGDISGTINPVTITMDSDKTITANFIVILPTLTSPNGAESWTAGTTRNITWTSSGVASIKLEYSTDNGANWSDIAAGIDASTGSYAWVVPEEYSTNCLVRISDPSNPGISDVSDAVFVINKSHEAQPINWSQIADLQTQQHASTAKVIDGFVYLVGGQNDSGPPNLNIMRIYNPNTNTWSSSPSMPTRRYWPGSGVIEFNGNRELYIVGGYSGYSGLSTVERYVDDDWSTPGDGNWESAASISQPRGHGIMCSVVNNTLYAIGGFYNGGSYYNTNEMYDRESNTWISREPLPLTLQAGLQVVYDSKIYIFGGHGNGGSNDFVLVYDTITDSWEQKSNLPNQRGYNEAVIFGEYIYLIANVHQGDNNKIIDVYLPATDSWTTIDDYPGGNWAYPTITQNANTVYVLGTSYSLPEKLECWAGNIQDYEITVTLTSPNGAESWEASSTQNITWTSTSVTNVKLEYTTNNGTDWTDIIASTDASAGSYSWLVPIRPSVNCKVRISDASDATKTDVSDAVFSINESTGETILSIRESRTGDGNSEIYVMNADGSNQTNLTNNMSTEDTPSWSPDGSKIVYTSMVDGDNEIYVMDADGSNQTRLTDNIPVNLTPLSPHWSPDGSKIVYITYIDDNYEIYVMDADGSNQTRLTNNTSNGSWPSWSPDGSKIVFVSDRDSSADIFVMDADGSNQTRLTNGTSPSWSPDGSKFVFASGGIYVMDADGSNQTRLTNGSSPSWSPDGSKIVFASSVGGDFEIYVMDADGSNQTRLTNNPARDYYPAWARPVYAAPKIVTLTTPNGAESWEASTTQNITWTSTDVTNVKLEYSTNSGTTWTDIVASTAASAGSYSWLVPIRPSVNCIVRVSDASNASVNDVSDAVFTIAKGVQLPIAFVSTRDGNYEIYVMNSDGTNLTRLTNNPSDDLAPSWSPDGSKITFSSKRDGNYEIYIMNADGTNQTRLTNNSVFDEDPSWSPDGSKITFSSKRDGSEEIFIMDADGSNQISLTNSAYDNYPSWSPDSAKIIFDSDKDGNKEIYFMNNDGSNQTRLTNNSAIDRNPYWSPDGSKIAFTSQRDGNEEIYVMNSDGSNQTRLTNNTADDYNPSWSSDGLKITFQSYKDGNAEIYVMNADGSNQTNLTNNSAKDYESSWQKSTSVFVTSPQGGETWTTGTTETITWVHNGVSDVKIEYSTDGGSIWNEIIPSTAASNTTTTAGSYEWIVEETASTNCLVRITDIADASVTDISN